MSTAYGYDIFNRLTNAGSANLAYDAAGRLRETNVGGASVTRFLYDGADMIGEYNSSNALLRRYVFGPGVDEPLVWYEGTGVSDRRYLVADERGSIVAVTNGAGAASGTGFGINAYDEYGNPGPSNLGRFQYTGQAWLPEAQLYHYKARAYSPSLGRFLQTDPIGFGGGMNLYAYVGNDPVNASDPSGLVEEDEIVVTARIVARIDPCGGRAGCISDPQQIRDLIDNMGRTRDDFGSSVHEGSGDDVIVVICGRVCRNSRHHPTIMIGLGGGAAGTSEGGGWGGEEGGGPATSESDRDARDFCVAEFATAGTLIGLAAGAGLLVASTPVVLVSAVTLAALAGTAAYFHTQHFGGGAMNNGGLVGNVTLALTPALRMLPPNGAMGLGTAVGGLAGLGVGQQLCR